MKKALRSFDKSPKLLRRTCGDMRATMVGGEETGVYTVDLKRLQKVMEGIASALYFHEFGLTYPFDWWIYGASLTTRQSLSGLPDFINEKLREAFSQLVVSDRHTSEPEIFKYGMYEDGQSTTIYRMEFYEAVVIYALGSPNLRQSEPKVSSSQSN